jgi:SAM-dependent methyltransferase
VALPQHVAGRLLDLGCGKVPLFGAYKDRVTDTVCVDWSDGDHVDLVCDLAQALPFADGSFQTVIASDVLEHLADPQFAWREIARVLAPGGVVLLNVPFLYPIHAHPHDHFRYTGFALAHFMRSQRLEPVALQPIGGLFEVLADIGGKVLARVPLLGHTLAALQQRLAIAFARSAWGERLAQVTARNYPLGYFAVARKPR